MTWLFNEENLTLMLSTKIKSNVKKLCKQLRVGGTLSQRSLAAVPLNWIHLVLQLSNYQ